MRAVAARRRAFAAGAAVCVVGAALALVPIGGGRAGRPQVRAEAPVTAMDLGRGVANNSPNLVADPADDRFVAMANRLDAPDFGCALQVSGDGGGSWQTVQPISTPPAGAEKCYAGEAAFDGDGRLYFLFVGLQGNGNEPMGAFLTSSGDRGRTFSPPRQVLGPLHYAVRLAIDPSAGERGRIHLVWLRASADPPLGGLPATANPIESSHSDDGGQTFSAPVQVSDPARSRVVAPALALGPSGSVHVAYYDLQDDARDYQGLAGPTFDGSWTIVVSSSTDGGRRFGPGVVVDDRIAAHERVMLIFTMPPPALAVDDDRVCVAWTDARTGDADAVLRCSVDAARTWGDLRRLNDDPEGNGRRQYQPRLGLAPDGRLDAVFYDQRDDPEGSLTHVSYTFSADGARTFAPNRTLTSEPSNTQIGQRYANVAAQGLVEFGSRVGLLSRTDRVVAAWTDTRNSRGGTNQDIFTGGVEFPDRSRAVWPRLAGVALLALGLAVVLVTARSRRRSIADRDQPGGPA